jgi:hypothetical protein
LVGERLSVSCKTKPGVLGVQEIVALPREAGTIVSVGAFVVCTAVGKAQNPPVTEYSPLVIGPPVLVLPPPSMVDQVMAYWVKAES